MAELRFEPKQPDSREQARGCCAESSLRSGDWKDTYQYSGRGDGCTTVINTSVRWPVRGHMMSYGAWPESPSNTACVLKQFPCRVTPQGCSRTALTPITRLLVPALTVFVVSPTNSYLDFGPFLKACLTPTGPLCVISYSDP